MGKLVYNLADYQNAARKYKSVLLRMPLMQLSEILPYVTLRTGVTYEEAVGTSSLNAELAPYVAGRRTDANLNLDYRVLRTYFGSVNADFEPNAAIQTLMGHKAAQALGDAQIKTPQAKEVLALVAKSIGYNLNNGVFNAVRNANGTTSKDLYDGFDTITDDEIEDGNISVAKKNLVELNAAIDKTNAVDMLKEIMYKMTPELRQEDCFLFCPYEVADAYNAAYKLESGGIVYNTKYNQVSVEGSNNKLTIVPLTSKAGSKYIHIAPARNMLIGVDQLSDAENIDVKEFAPDVLTFMAKMFFGVQFESLDPRRMLVAKLYEEPNELYEEPNELYEEPNY